MWLPPGWKPDLSTGCDFVRRLIHTPCGWRSPLPYDLICHEGQARQIVTHHTCRDGGDGGDREVDGR